MPDDIGEECGLAAISMKENGNAENRGLFYLYKMLLNLQHRGQLSAGVTTYNKNRPQIIDTLRNIGTVNEVFSTSSTDRSAQIFKRYSGTRGIGHVRYATSGLNERRFAHPFERHHGRLWKWFSFGFNGNLVNYYALREELQKKKDYHFSLDNDTEIIMHYIAKEMDGDKRPSLTTVFSNLSRRFEGAYNVNYLNAYGEVAITRDPLGFRPACYAIQDGNFAAASESVALQNIGFEDIKSLEPGHIAHVENGDIKIEQYAKSKGRAHCMFEWVYFSNVASILDGKSVYLTRTNLGKELAKLETQKMDANCVCIPVPDSAKAAGDAYAYTLGIPSVEGLIRNRFVGRTFIESTSRADKIRSKYTIIKEVVRDKRIFLVDDSVVRGSTTIELVQSLKRAGAREVHVRVTCPAIIGPCFYGIDMSTVSELIAPRFMDEPSDQMPEASAKKLAKFLGADSVVYQTVSGLIRAIGLPKKQLCTACLTREYPTPTGEELIQISLKNFREGKPEDGRTIEMMKGCHC
ncbi:amidophosphoribosyltransferase [Candidatus Woesearchaeota archaeon]|nr:amidophosphoribosyltransferase [Candidatus Woesearchaeota archaeon]